MAIVRILFCATVLAFQIAAQDGAALEALSGDPASRLAREWIHDGDPRHRGWAAHWIGRDELRDFVPELVEQLNAYSYRESTGPLTPEDASMQAVADALIRLDATVPAEAAMHLYPQLPSQTLLLLAKSGGDRSGALYRIFNETKMPEIWLAAANLLAAQHPERIAKHLLDKFTMRVTIRVVEPRPGLHDDFWGGGGGCASDFGLGPLYGIDWPTIWQYGLRTDGEPGIPVLAPGRTPVYYAHWESPDYIPHPESSQSCRPNRKQVFLRGLLEQLLGMASDTLSLHSEARQTIAFTSDVQYRQRMTAILQAKEELFDSVVRDLAKQGLLPGLGAESLKLHVSLIIDDRTQRTAPQPAIDLESLGIIAN